MEFKKDFLAERFREYYKKTGNTATHVFIHSRTQDCIPKYMCDGKECYINNKRYSEMRNRDSSPVFGHEDSNFVSVGCYNDVERR